MTKIIIIIIAEVLEQMFRRIYAIRNMNSVSSRLYE